MLIAWLDGLGSRSFFSSFTIDCSNKAVTAGRLGTWAPGKQRGMKLVVIDPRETETAARDRGR